MRPTSAVSTSGNVFENARVAQQERQEQRQPGTSKPAPKKEVSKAAKGGQDQSACIAEQIKLHNKESEKQELAPLHVSQTVAEYGDATRKTRDMVISRDVSTSTTLFCQTCGKSFFEHLLMKRDAVADDDVSAASSKRPKPAN